MVVYCLSISFIPVRLDASFVEFINPKHRRELEKKDEEIKKATGLKGAAPGGDDWVWLTSYSRIPVSHSLEKMHIVSRY